MRLGFSEQQNKEPAADRLIRVLTAVLLGSSTMAVLCSAFRLSWRPAKAFTGNPVSGFLSVCNSIADQLGESDYIILRKFAGGASPDGSGLPQGMCLTIMLLLGILLAYLILRSNCSWLLLLLSGPAVLLLLLTHTAPGVHAGLFFVFAQVCAFALMYSQNGGAWQGLLLPAAVLCVTFLAGAAIDHGPGFPTAALQRTSGAAIENALHDRHGRNPLGGGQLKALSGEDLKKQRGSLDRALRQMAGEAADDTKTALTIAAGSDAAGEMKPCYLRGFVGEVYQDGNWSAMQPDQYYRHRNALYWMNRQGFDGLSQLSEAAGLTGDEASPVRLTVKTKKADRSQVYAPYELVGTDRALPKGTVNYAGAFPGPAKKSGSREYTWEMHPGLTGQWTDLVGRLYSADSSEALQKYFVSESHYNVWCYENDTKVPGELAGLIYAAMGDPGDLSRSHADYRETITQIRDYMDEQFIYTERFNASGERTDPLETFLTTGKGSDAHYASLAALLFRYYGIPARYVEGYLVTPKDAERIAAGGTAEIGFSHAHAWPEIYIDGFGWVPLEVTGEYRNIMPEADLEKGLESISYAKKQQELAQTPPEENSENGPAENYGSVIRKILLGLLLTLLLILLFWILQKAVRRWIAHRRWRTRFADPDPRKGVCAMYGFMMREDIPLSPAAVAIGNLAAYSEYEIGEADRADMRMELKRGQDEKKEMDKQMRGSLADRLSDAVHRLRR